MPHGTNKTPICPRCGYDLKGTTSTWSKSCPVDGRCTECGFELQWSDVFTFSEHPWLFEYHWRRGPVRRLVLTVLNALMPWRFWRSVKLTEPVYLRPAMIVAGACLAMGLIAAVISETQGRHSVNQWWFAGTPQTNDAAYWLQLIGEVLLDLPRVLLDRVPGLAVALFSMPLLFVLVPVTLRRAKVRRAHVLRIWMYSLAFPAMLGTCWLAAELLTEFFGWHAVNRVLDPWAWLPYSASYGEWWQMLLYAWLPGTAVLTIGSAWMGVWWWFACRRYLRIPDSGLMIVLLTVVLWILSFGVEVYVQW